MLSRGLAALDTWMPTHSVIYTSHGNYYMASANYVSLMTMPSANDPGVPSIPTVGMIEEKDVGRHAAHLIQLRGLADLYRRFPDRCVISA